MYFELRVTLFKKFYFKFPTKSIRTNYEKEGSFIRLINTGIKRRIIWSKD